LHPIITGGNVSQWGIEPSPLSGLTFADGLLSGTPTINQTAPIMYTIYANTTGGTITHTINISVLEPVVDLFYNPENQTLTRAEQIVVWLPTVSGGVPETWEIEPALPNGLIFENGTITGSPTVNSTTTQYTVWANNSGGLHHIDQHHHQRTGPTNRVCSKRFDTDSRYDHDHVAPECYGWCSRIMGD